MPSGGMSANAAGFYAELNSDTTRQSFVHFTSKILVFLQVQVDLWLPIQEAFDVVFCERSRTFETGSRV